MRVRWLSIGGRLTGLAILSALAWSLACGGPTPSPPPPTVAPTATPVPTPPPTATPETASTASDIGAILATTVLEVGEQRLAFLLTSPKGLIKDADVKVTPVYLEDGSAGPTLDTSFHVWPYEVRGAYATSVEFDRAGAWRLDIDVRGGEASGLTTLEVEVATESPVPALGSTPPLSDNKTLGGRERHRETDHRLYARSGPLPGLHRRSGGGTVADGDSIRHPRVLHHGHLWPPSRHDL